MSSILSLLISLLALTGVIAGFQEVRHANVELREAIAKIGVVPDNQFGIATYVTQQGGTGTSSYLGTGHIFCGDNTGQAGHCEIVAGTNMTISTTTSADGLGTWTFSAAGGGAAFAWTPTSYGVSTSTTLGLLNGFISTASSTFTSGLQSFASSTIGNGTDAGGLTISGGATTTGNHLVEGNLDPANIVNFFGTACAGNNWLQDIADAGTFSCGALDTTGDWTGTIDGNNFAGGAVAAGDLLYGSGAGTIAELGIGASSTILTNNGSTPAWTASPSLSTLRVTNLTSALVVTGAAGELQEYAGTSCTNQFVRSLSALGAATCNSVSLSADVTGTLPIANGGTNQTSFTNKQLVAFDGTSLVSTSTIYAGIYGAASIDGDDINSNIAGRSLTLTSASPDTLDADAELYTFSWSYNFASSTMGTTTAVLQKKIPVNSTITSIDCVAFGPTGTTTLQLDERTNRLTAGTNVLGGNGIACGTQANTSSSTIPNASMAAGSFLSLDIEGYIQTAFPTSFTLDVTLTHDD